MRKCQVSHSDVWYWNCRWSSFIYFVVSNGEYQGNATYLLDDKGILSWVRL